jgi:hypothetical protein
MGSHTAVGISETSGQARPPAGSAAHAGRWPAVIPVCGVSRLHGPGVRDQGYVFVQHGRSRGTCRQHSSAARGAAGAPEARGGADQRGDCAVRRGSDVAFVPGIPWPPINLSESWVLTNELLPDASKEDYLGFCVRWPCCVPVVD